MTATALNEMLLVLLLAAALWTVLTGDLLRSAIGLALTSAVLTLLLFRMQEPLAGVFELSVCAGLITVVFVSAISLTKPSDEAIRKARAERWKRYLWLPFLLVAAGWWLCFRATIQVDVPPPPPEVADVRQVLWFGRRFDLLGQLLVILAGVFGVVVLFKAWRGAAEEAE